MTDVFLGFLNRSLSAAILIFAIVLIRLVFTEVAAMRPVGTGGSAAFVSGFGRKRPEPHPERGDCAARDRLFRRARHHKRHPSG